MTSSFSLSAGSLFMLGLASLAAAAPDYKLVENWQGKNFLDYFNFHTGSDPTNGFVTYLNKGSAEDAGLVKYTDSGSVYIGVDHKTKLSSSGPGRNSVRIGSKKYYDKSLIVADIAHMPGSACGTWPAFWSVGQNWPADGEIDIIEGVNLQDHNEIVMHTAGTCSIQDGGMTGAVNATGCGEDLGTVGCVIEGGKGSYGTSFNKQGGGVYAMEWTEEYLKIWFFPRHSIPSSIAKGDPDVTEFGTPMALVQDGCDVANSFKAQSFVFDVTFCGDWAGGVFSESGCPLSSSDSFQSCTNYVAQNPAAFEQTYWEINSVKIYQTGTKGIGISSSHATGSKVHATHATANGAPETTALVETSASHAPATHGAATHASESGVIIETSPLHAPSSEATATHDTSTRMESATSPLVESLSEGWHTVAPAATTQGSSSAGIVAPVEGSNSESSGPTPAAGAFPSAYGTAPPGGSSPTATGQKPATTRYVTKLVTSTKTLCSLGESAAPSVPASHVAETPATAGTVTEPAYPETQAASQTVKAVAGPNEQQHTSHVEPITNPTAAQTTETASCDVPNAKSSADAVSNDRNESATTQPLPTVIPGPGYNLGSASLLPSTHPSQTWKPVNPTRTGSSAVSGSVFPGIPSIGAGPVFTGAADKLSSKFSTIAVVFVVAMIA